MPTYIYHLFVSICSICIVYSSRSVDIISCHTLLLGLNNSFGHPKSRSGMADVWCWDPTTSQFIHAHLGRIPIHTYIHTWIPKGLKMVTNLANFHTQPNPPVTSGALQGQTLIQYSHPRLYSPTTGLVVLSVLISKFPNWSGDSASCLSLLSRICALCKDNQFISGVLKRFSEPWNGWISMKGMGVGIRRGWHSLTLHYGLAKHPKRKRRSHVFSSFYP